MGNFVKFIADHGIRLCRHSKDESFYIAISLLTFRWFSFQNTILRFLRSNLTSLVDESYHNFFLLLEFQSTFSNLMFSYQMSNKIIIEIELLVIFLFSLSRKRRRKKKLKFSTSPKRFDFSPLSFFLQDSRRKFFLTFFFGLKFSVKFVAFSAQLDALQSCTTRHSLFSQHSDCSTDMF